MITNINKSWCVISNVVCVYVCMYVCNFSSAIVEMHYSAMIHSFLL